MFLFANSDRILALDFLYVMGIENKSIPENKRKERLNLDEEIMIDYGYGEVIYLLQGSIEFKARL